METEFPLSRRHSSKNYLPHQSYNKVQYLIDRNTIYDDLVPLSTNLCLWIINYGFGLTGLLKDTALQQSKFYFLSSLLSQANQSFGLIEGSFPRKDIMTAMKIVLGRCSDLLVELRNTDFNHGQIELVLCAQHFGMSPETVLNYFEFHVLYATASYYRFVRDDEQSNEYYMESFKVLLKYEIRDTFDFIFLIVDYATGILLKFRQKMFKQFRYLLHAVKTLMDGLDVERKQCESFKKLMQYWLYAWMLYGSELLVTSHAIQIIGAENNLNDSTTTRAINTFKIEDQCIKFDVQLIPQLIDLPDNLLKSANDVKKFYQQLLFLKEEMYVWGPLKVAPEVSSFEVMYKILLDAQNFFPFLKDVNCFF